MNTNNIKKYAPKARKAFIEAITKQAAKYGITEKNIEVAQPKGDLLLIGERAFPVSISKPREQLVKRIEQQGFDQVMEHVAYSWFNRLCAIRYMELKGFLDHGRRVLSHPESDTGFQILDDCLEIELPRLDQNKVRALKLDGTKDEELYRELLLAQCHALYQAMPFLFEAVADESELLLPDNLTKTNSLIRDLVVSIPEEDWENIEIIGWLYQFYISEKKDQVIGKVVKSEDIPAATQLFTPNWIVQYLVQNSVGRQWLQTYPDSPLKENMPYYIDTSEQTPEVQEQIKAITPLEITPESIKVLDPACGSGHILVEAYKVLKAIYKERGYRGRDIPKLILENNLFGLDIDDRAGQLAGFALMMLAREDDRRIFTRSAAAGGELKLNVLSLQESTDVNLPSLWRSLNLTGEWESGTIQGLFDEEQQDLGSFNADNRYQLLQRTLERFTQAKTFGSLIEVPHEELEQLHELFITLKELEASSDSMQKSAATTLIPYVHQALLLAQRYDAVVANPPYMGSKNMNSAVRSYVKSNYPESKTDLFSVYIKKSLNFAKTFGNLGMVTPYVWMFIGSYEKLRRNLVSKHTISSLIQLEYNAFSPACIPVCTFTVSKASINNYEAKFIKLTDFKGSENQPIKTLEAINNPLCGWSYTFNTSKFTEIAGCPIAYWIPDSIVNAFKNNPTFSEYAGAKQGLATADNNRFLRLWYEVSLSNIEFNQTLSNKSKDYPKKWYPHSKGGGYKRWYGNNDWVINWQHNGRELKNFDKCVIRNPGDYFKSGVTWCDLTSSYFNARKVEKGFVFDTTGPTAVLNNERHLDQLHAFMNSSVFQALVNVSLQGLHYSNGVISKIPVNQEIFNSEIIKDVSVELFELAKSDYDARETSWGFKKLPILYRGDSLNNCYKSYREHATEVFNRAKLLEEKNNKAFAEIYGMNDTVEIEIKDDLVSLYFNPRYRFDGETSSYNLENRFCSETISELLSYSLGCMMGRYSLDREGLVYAHSGNEGFAELVAEGVYKTFPADDDGIIPLTDQEWFPDDATNRFREFVKVVWGKEHLQENLDFVAESLCLHAIKPKKNESAMDTIRRYLSTQFYKDHLKTYKKRPIYWLFSSGKQKAFECLVYLHRYNEGTLSRMRTEYVIPLTAKMAAYVQKLENDKEASGSAAEVKRIEKEISQLHKQQAELSEFDEKLRHYADQRISLDLDDGVKVNYGKFGDLLAEVKAITGKKPEVLS